jgi:hypothetical protein
MPHYFVTLEQGRSRVLHSSTVEKRRTYIHKFYYNTALILSINCNRSRSFKVRYTFSLEGRSNECIHTRTCMWFLNWECSKLCNE